MSDILFKEIEKEYQEIAGKYPDFKPGDMLRGVINTNYHEPNRPYFDSIEMKGGGDAVSAARAVLQTGEYDYAWNLQVEDELLLRLEQGGKGKTTITPGGNIEFIQLNMADPWTEIEGERAHPKSKHPILSEMAVRQAISLVVDRDGVQKYIYGRTGIATSNFLNNPQRFVSKNTKFEFNIDKANAVLEAAGGCVLVEREAPVFPEVGQRDRTWLPVAEAATRVQASRDPRRIAATAMAIAIAPPPLCACPQ